MSRFMNLDETAIANILKDKDSNSTNKATEQSWRVFTAYCNDKQIVIDAESVEKKQLDNILKLFYMEARQPNGKAYTKTSLNCIRHGINRKLKSLRNNDIDIINEGQFTESGTAFVAQCTNLKRQGLAKTVHYPPIDTSDLQKLRSSDIFNTSNPGTLQYKVFFDIMYYFCRRGQENLRQLTKDSFVITKNPDGVKYAEKIVDELSKNHRNGDEQQEGGLMFETSGDDCPVASLELYLSKLNPKLDAFFQKAKNLTPKDGPWYNAQAIGTHTLEKFMKTISEKAELSRVYTNHSVRATTITILDGVGTEARHIQTVSGHRSETSIRSYSRTGIQMKRKMSEILSEGAGTSVQSKSQFLIPREKVEKMNKSFDFGINNFDSPPQKKQVTITNCSNITINL